MHKLVWKALKKNFQEGSQCQLGPENPLATVDITDQGDSKFVRYPFNFDKTKYLYFRVNYLSLYPNSILSRFVKETLFKANVKI